MGLAEEVVVAAERRPGDQLGEVEPLVLEAPAAVEAVQVAPLRGERRVDGVPGVVQPAAQLAAGLGVQRAQPGPHGHERRALPADLGNEGVEVGDGRGSGDAVERL